MAILNPVGQWSRPSAGFNLGVLPNSPAQITMVRDSKSRCFRSRINDAKAGSSTGTTVSSASELTNAMARYSPKDKVTITWRDTSTTEDGFLVYRIAILAAGGTPVVAPEKIGRFAACYIRGQDGKPATGVQVKSVLLD